jgi:rubrerythrin
MSQRSRPALDVADLPAPICDYCGFTIDDDDDPQDCPARDHGRCFP